MQDEILLRKLIREILLNEDEGGDIGLPSDAGQNDIGHMKVGYDGRASFGASTSHSSGYGPAGGPFNGGGTLFSPLANTLNTVWNQGANVAGALTNAAAKFLAVKFVATNPWTMTLLGDSYIKNYLDTVSKGSTGQITGKLVQAAIYDRFNIPQIAAAVRVSGIPILFSGVAILGKRLSMDPHLGSALNEIGQNINDISTEIKNINPKIKQELGVLFSNNSEYKKEGLENFIYTQIQEIKKNKRYNSPLTPSVTRAISSVDKFLYENPELNNKNKLTQTLSKSMGQRDAESLANMIMTLKSK